MKCSTARQYIELYCDDELRQEQELLLKKHLRECPTCSDQLRMTDRVSSILQNVEPPDSLRFRVGDTISAIRPTYPSIRAQHPPIWRASVSWSMAAGLTVLLTFAATMAPQQSKADRIWQRAFFAMQKVASVKGTTSFEGRDGWPKRNTWYFKSEQKLDFAAGKVWIDASKGTWEWYPAVSSGNSDSVALTAVPFSSEKLGTTSDVQLESTPEGSFYKIVVNVTNQQLLEVHGAPVRSVNYINPDTYLPEQVRLQRYEDGAWVQFGITRYEYNVADPFAR